MIKNLVFDMGNTIFQWNPDHFIDVVGVTDKEDRATLRHIIYDSPEWQLTDWGFYTEEEMEALAEERLPEHLKQYAHHLVCEWDKPEILPVPGMADLICKAKKAGYRIYLLSNAGLRHKEYWPRMPAADAFDGVVVSAFLKLMKPDPRIYEHLLSKFSLKADECLFIDDLVINIAGAKFCGLNTYLFDGDAAKLDAFIFNN